MEEFELYLSFLISNVYPNQNETTGLFCCAMVPSCFYRHSLWNTTAFRHHFQKLAMWNYLQQNTLFKILFWIAHTFQETYSVHCQGLYQDFSLHNKFQNCGKLAQHWTFQNFKSDIWSQIAFLVFFRINRWTFVLVNFIVSWCLLIYWVRDVRLPDKQKSKASTPWVQYLWSKSF